MAMVHGAVYDAVNSVDRTHAPYRVLVDAPAGASREAAAAAAAHRALTSLYPSRAAVFDARFAASLDSLGGGSDVTAGVNLGRAAADQMIAWRTNDGATDVVPYAPGTAPGQWRPTPPAHAPALLPNWPDVTPFAISSGSQFRTAGPPVLGGAEYAADYNEVKLLGSMSSAIRTAEQTETARFWADGAGTETPPGHWNSIARSVASAKGTSLSENARLFALLNIAAADAAIVSWDSKYEYGFWRPVTAIREGDADGNAATLADLGWTPLLVTPPFPENTSGHSTFSGAASTVLAEFFGTDDVSFITGSDGLPGVYRSFDGFSDAADEAGRSRIYGGIHFEFSNEQGLAAGRDLGHYVSTNYFTAVPEPSCLPLLGVALLFAARRRARARDGREEGRRPRADIF